MIAPSERQRLASQPTSAGAQRPTNPLLGWRVTFGGIVYWVVVTIIGVAALNNDANLLFLVSGIGAGIGLFSAILPVRLLRKIEVDRVIPSAVTAGHSFKVQYVVRNRRRWWPSWCLVIGEADVRGAARLFPRVFVSMIKARQEQRLAAYGQCPMRGRVELSGIRVVCRFPFGLFSCSLTIPQASELVVYPSLGRLRKNPWREARQSGPQPMRTNKTDSAGEEFYGVREYRQGDNLRWVHWRRSARVGELVVREMAHLRVAQLVVILDPWPEVLKRREKRRPNPDVERLISTAASLICDALEHGYRVGLIARGENIEVIPPTGGRQQRPRLLHALALLAAGEADPIETVIPHIRWATGSQTRCAVMATRFQQSHQRLVDRLVRRADGLLPLSCESNAVDALIEFGSAGGRTHD